MTNSVILYIPKTKWFGYSSWLFIITIALFSCNSPEHQSTHAEKFDVLAYYAGDYSEINKYPVEKLTHIIYSFLHLKGNRLKVDDSEDSLTLRELVRLKNRNKDLKVLLSLGGWGGCKPCSDVFATEKGRKEFALSVKDLLLEYETDGLDLDWEYPAIEGFPGHTYKDADRHNFTLLVRELRDLLGDAYEISFAAGGFTKFLEESIEWEQVMPLLDRVNVMTYDLVSGYSKVTGHHTPLASSAEQKESVEHAVSFLDSIGVARKKIVIGAAFYARVWEDVENINNGLYQSGNFKRGVQYKQFEEILSDTAGFDYHWDNHSKAPYSYNPGKKLFATYDDSNSINLKTRYVIEESLGGIMFWQLVGDKYQNGLLDVIDSTIKGIE